MAFRLAVVGNDRLGMAELYHREVAPEEIEHRNERRVPALPPRFTKRITPPNPKFKHCTRCLMLLYLEQRSNVAAFTVAATFAGRAALRGKICLRLPTD
jgi:hypothetical protein